MANCSISTAFTRTCGFGFGGIQKAYLVNKDDISSVAADATGQITGITLASGATFLRYEFEPQQASFSEAYQGGNISKFFLQTLTMNMAGQTQEQKNELEALALSSVAALVQTQDDKWWLLGEKGAGLTASQVDLDSGTANADNYVNLIVLSGGNAGKANQVSAAAVALVI